MDLKPFQKSFVISRGFKKSDMVLMVLVIMAHSVRIITLKVGGLLIHAFVLLPLHFQTSVHSGQYHILNPERFQGEGGRPNRNFLAEECNRDSKYQGLAPALRVGLREARGHLAPEPRGPVLPGQRLSGRLGQVQFPKGLWSAHRCTMSSP